MPLAQTIPPPVPQSWTIFGHSYFQMAFGTRTQQGRPDGAMRALLYNQQFLNVINHAQAGTRLAIQGDFGFGRVLNVVKGWTGGAGNLGNTAPYVVGGQGGSGGGYLIGYGINDVGFSGASVQNNTAYQHAMRTAISRCRMSTLGSTNAINYPGGTGSFTTSGGWFTATASAGFATGGAANLLSTLAGGNSVTITLPADYNGEVVAICVIGTSNTTSGAQNLWTFSGTAGVTGTFTSDLILPQTSLSNCPVTKRIKNLTSANAGQTIVLTLTTLGGSGIGYFDSWWLEADNAPPVIVCNTARLCASPNGYATYATTRTATGLSGTAVSSTPATIPITGTAGQLPFGFSSAGTMTIPSAGGTVTITYAGINSTPALTGCSASGGGGNYTSNTLSYPGPTDADVTAFNTYLTSLAGEFDAMVQIADIDTALNKSPLFFCFDGLHMNELGAARMAQAILAAVQHLSPTSPAGQAANLNPPFPVITPMARPYVSGQYYTSDCFGGANGTAYTCVAGDMWALPIFVSSGVSAWAGWSMEMVATTSAAPTVFFAVYEDRMMQGYPMSMHIQPANSSALTLLAAPGVFTSTTTPGNNGYLNQAVDPGLYWLVVKIVTAGTCALRTCKGPSWLLPNLASTGGGGVTPCGWKLTGQGAGAMSGRFPSGAALVDNVPMIGVKPILAQS